MALKSQLDAPKKKRNTGKVVFIIIVVLLLVAAALFYGQTLLKDDTEESTMQTTRVRTGDIVITANGAGTVMPAYQMDMGFRSGGTLAELNVALGDTVSYGDVLACLDSSPQSKADFDVLFSVSGIAQAEAQVVQAQNAFEAAETRLTAVIDPSVYYYETQLVNALSAQAAINADTSASLEARESVQKEVELARANLDIAWLNSYSNPSDETIILARADLEAARDTLKDAQTAHQIITAGTDSLASPIIVTGAQTSKLEKARQAADDACLSAPFDGTVTSLSAITGQTVGTAPIIKIAAAQDMLVRIYLDETDLDKATQGNRVQLTFDAYPDLIVEGEIVIVEPALDVVDGTPVVVTWVTIPEALDVTILAGMTVDAEVVAHEALGALLIPMQALRELDPGSYAVFVVQEDGTLLLTPVTTGLRDFANVQILSGLNAGDIVSTGTVETK